MGKLKIKISFDGHKYYGWQKQNQSLETVQGHINKALQCIYKKTVNTIGSGRTDAHVHSLSHYAVFSPPFDINNESLVRALNSQLPEDIRVHECQEVEDNFRPTNDAKLKEYRYLFSNLKVPSPFQAHYITNISYDLDFDLMQRACKLFIGEHDYHNFHCTGSEPSSTIRKILEFELIEHQMDFHGILPNHYYFRIVGNGFLKQMVRLMVGSIWDIGRGKLELSDIENALNRRVDKHIAPVAAPNGLYKYSVQY